MISARRAQATCLVTAALLPSMAPAQSNLPCESYSQSGAVFIGTAGAPVTRIVQLPDHPLLEMTFTPIEVEQAYLGVSTPVMYVTPAPKPGPRQAGSSSSAAARITHPTS